MQEQQPQVQHGIMKASDLSNAAMREILDGGWEINPPGYILLLRHMPQTRDQPAGAPPPIPPDQTQEFAPSQAGDPSPPPDLKIVAK